jgi:hypothetical protein
MTIEYSKGSQNSRLGERKQTLTKQVLGALGVFFIEGEGEGAGQHIDGRTYRMNVRGLAGGR